MPLDPDLKRVLDLYREGPRFEPAISVEEYRRFTNRIFEAIARLEYEAVSRVEDKIAKGRNGDIRIRVYQQKANSAALVYYHGGGFVLCNLETHDAICRRIARLSNATVVSVDYRLAPEHKFPAAVYDAYDALRWVADHAEEMGVDKDRIFVGGDSAGGNLATVVSIIARDKGENFVKGQFLIYPVVNLSGVTPSKLEFGSRGILTEEIMAWFNRHYLESIDDARNPLASPIFAELGDLPPALIATAEYDPLRDEAELYGALMRKSGSEAVVVRYNGMIHGFLNFYPLVRAGKELISQISAAIAFA